MKLIMTENKKKSNIEVLNERLKEVHDKFIKLKESGIDEEILEIYLKEKLKTSRGKVKQFLNELEGFYDKLIKHEIIESFK